MNIPTSIDDALDEASFPGNSAAFNKLRSLLETGKITTFVGAGASIPLYPSWSSLLVGLAEKARDEGAVTQAEFNDTIVEAESDPLYCANLVQDQLQKPIFRAELARIFRDRSECTERHRLIMRLPAKAHVTLNYDNGLEVAYVEDRHQYHTSIKSHEKTEIIR